MFCFLVEEGEINMDEEFEKALNEFAYWQDKYCEVYGEGSLEYIFFFNPRHPETKDFQRASKILQRVIRRGKPLRNEKPMGEIIY